MRMSQVTMHAEVFDRFPGMSVAVAVARGIDNQADQPAVTARWRAAWAEAAQAATYGNA
jgi:DNA/RNA-binding domain of Phe-tRNA-synthetase-like protein